MTCNEKPKPVWVPRGYYSVSKIKDDDVQMVISEEMDAWLRKVKPYVELAEDIMETFNQNLSPDEVLALYKSRTFTEKRYAILSEALLKAEKLEAIKTIIAEVEKKETIGARRMRSTTHYMKILKILEGV